MGITLDGYAENGAAAGNQTSGTVTLSTTLSNDVVEVVIYANGGSHSGSPHTVASVTSPNVTWTLRKRVDDTVNDHVLEKWHGVASAPLTNELITFTFSSQLDNWAATARGWGGVNTSSPYTTNVSLPAGFEESGSSENPSISGCSTSEAQTVMVTDVGDSGNSNHYPSGSQPSGWTICGTQAFAPGGVNFAETASAYQIETSVQTNLTVTWQVTVLQFCMIVDALVAVPVPGLGAHSQSVGVGF